MSAYSTFLAAIGPASGAVRKARGTRGAWLPATVLFALLAAVLAPVVSMGYGMRMVMRGVAGSAPTATQLLITTQPEDAVAGGNISLVAKAYLADGTTVDTSFDGTVTLSKASGDGTLGGTVSVAAVAGVATFSAATVARSWVATTNLHTLTASATGLTSVTSDSFEVRAGALDGVSATRGAVSSTYARMFKTYTGSLGTITRASDSTTHNIAFAAGFDRANTTAVDSFLSATTGRVSTIKDQSGNGYDHTESSGSGLSYAATGLNSLPAINGNGSNMRLDRTSGVPTAAPIAVYATFGGTWSAAGTVWGAADNSVANQRLACLLSTGGGGQVAILADASSATTVTGTGSYNDGAAHVGEWRFDAADDRVVLADGEVGDQATSAVSLVPTGIDRVAIGIIPDSTPSGAMQSDQILGEIAEFTTEPSTADRNLIGAAMAAIRGVTWNTIP